MKQTAVEWLEEKFTNSNADFINWAEEYFEQAKEIEKQQIIDAYRNGKTQQLENSEIYYNEKFKNK
jgi:HEPN domain-containing protein